MTGQLEADSDVRSVMKFLVALKGCGGDVKKKVTLAEIKPRIVHVGKVRTVGVLPLSRKNEFYTSHANYIFTIQL